MFKKLRNRIVGITMLSTTIVLLIAFSVIYSSVKKSAENRPFPRPQTNFNVSFGSGERINFDEELKERINEDRKENLKVLLISLTSAGLSIEVIVFLFSLQFANKSIKPVKETYEAQKQFIANASHEIKTPLAVIQANLEAADIKDNEWIDNATKKVEELSELNSQLLTLARIDANTLDLKKSEVELKKIIKEQLSPLKPQIEKKGIELNIEANDSHKVQTNKSALKQVINILLDNAIKYCDKKIDLKIYDREIIITNDGTTIAPEKIAHLFERFYQVDKTKNGVGLGLAIAKQISDKNNWKLSAKSDSGKTSFMLKI